MEGLGSLRYVSSFDLVSTIEGLGTFNYLSTVDGYFRVSSIEVSSLLVVDVLATGSNTLRVIGSSILDTLLTSSVQTFDLNTSTLITSSIQFDDQILTVSSQAIYINDVLYPLIIDTTPSTIEGLGTFGYLSSYSTSIFQNDLTSTIIGLGTLGYLSSFNTIIVSLQSTVRGLGSSGYLSSYSTTIFQNNLTSTTQGLGTLGYLSSYSTSIFQNNLTSTIIGLGSSGYLSSLNGIIVSLQSTVQGLGSSGYLSSYSTSIFQNNLTSTILGLGTYGYLSSYSTTVFQNNLTSTTTGLGTLGYLSSYSTTVFQSNLTSTIIGLGTDGYLSSYSTTVFQSNLISTTQGLGSLGYLSSLNNLVYVSNLSGYISLSSIPPLTTAFIYLGLSTPTNNTIATPLITSSTFNQRFVLRDYSRTSALILNATGLSPAYKGQYFYIKNLSQFTTCTLYQTFNGTTSTLVNTGNPDNAVADIYKAANSQNTPFLVVVWTGSNFFIT